MARANMPYKLVGSAAMMVEVCTGTAVLLWRWHDSMAWLSGVLGLCVGWAAGILIAPYKSEKETFRDYSKIAAGFLTGFLVGKVDQVFNLVMDKDRGLLMLNEIFVRRIMVGTCCFFIAMIGTFLARQYYYYLPRDEM